MIIAGSTKLFIRAIQIQKGRKKIDTCYQTKITSRQCRTASSIPQLLRFANSKEKFPHEKTNQSVYQSTSASKPVYSVVASRHRLNGGSRFAALDRQPVTGSGLGWR